MKAMQGCRATLHKGREAPSREGSHSAAQSSAWSGTSNQHQFILWDCETEQEHFVSGFISQVSHSKPSQQHQG